MDAPRKARSSDLFPARGNADGPLLRDLFYLALAIRALALIPVLWAFASGEPPYLGGDWGAFHGWAKGILSGAGMLADGLPTAEYTPLYPLFIAGVYAIAGVSPWAVLAAQTVVGALACPIIAAAAGELSGARGGAGRKCATIAGLLYALYPPFIKAEHLVMTESLYVFWVIVCLWVLVRLNRRFSWGGMALLGLAGALGSLTKPSLAIFPVVCGAALVVRDWARTKDFWRPAGKGLVMALVFAAVLSPWVVRNYGIFGRFVPLGTEGGAVFYDGVNLKDGWKPGFRTKDEVTARAARIASEPERSAFLMGAGLKKIASDPSRLPRLLGVKALFFWSPFDWEIFLGGTYSFGFVFLLPFAVCAFLKRRPAGGMSREDGWRASRLWPVWGIVLYFFLLGIVFIGSPRLRLPAEAGILVLAALGIVRYLETSRRGTFWTVSGVWLAVNLLVFFLSDALRSMLRGIF